jgi:hypothetical protein
MTTPPVSPQVERLARLLYEADPDNDNWIEQNVEWRYNFAEQDRYRTLAQTALSESPAAKLVEFAEWLVTLDDDDPGSTGRRARQTVTLTLIIDKAREALA